MPDWGLHCLAFLGCRCTLPQGNRLIPSFYYTVIVPLVPSVCFLSVWKCHENSRSNKRPVNGPGCGLGMFLRWSVGYWHVTKGQGSNAQISFEIGCLGPRVNENSSRSHLLELEKVTIFQPKNCQRKMISRKVLGIFCCVLHFEMHTPQKKSKYFPLYIDWPVPWDVKKMMFQNEALCETSFTHQDVLPLHFLRTMVDVDIIPGITPLALAAKQSCDPEIIIELVKLNLDHSRESLLPRQ